MSAEAAVSAVFARKIEAIEDPTERERFVAERTAEYASDLDLLRLAADLHVDAVVPNNALREELLRRLEAADAWEREPQRRHHPVTPV